MLGGVLFRRRRRPERRDVVALLARRKFARGRQQQEIGEIRAQIKALKAKGKGTNRRKAWQASEWTWTYTPQLENGPTISGAIHFVSRIEHNG